MIFYTDQNNNQYIITNTCLTYIPIQAKQSSSGLYSGGKKQKKMLLSLQFTELEKLAEVLFINNQNHTLKREMLTSILSKKNNELTSQVILKQSKDRTTFENYIQEILK